MMETDNLIDLCKRGDRAAIGELYNTYSKRMLSLICHYVSDWSAAQDILHDGFLIVFSRIGQLKDPSKIEFWMGSIMKNLALQYLKHTDITLLLSDDYDIPDIPEFEEAISLDVIDTMINRLPLGYRKVFKLAVLEHMSHKEIGKLLGISEQTSGSQLFHARVMLRKMITQHRIEKGLLLICATFVPGILFKLYNPPPSISHSIVYYNTIADYAEPTTNSIISTHKKSPLPYIEENYITYNQDVDTIEAYQQLLVQSGFDSIPVVKTDAPYKYISKGNSFIPSSFGNKGFSLSAKGNTFAPKAINHPTSQIFDNPDYTNPGDETEEKVTHASPLTFSIVASKEIADRWYFDCGLQYNILNSKKTTTFKNGNNIVSKIKTEYIGIPLQIRYKFLTLNKLSLYSGIGASVHFPISGKINEINDNGTATKSQFTPSVQYAVSGSVGIEYHLSPSIGIFIEPSINHYFKSASNHHIIWQDKPCQFTVPIGIRLNW